MNAYNFNGEDYNDDRMFVLYLCKCTEDTQSDHIATTIYHENPPPDAGWCLVTYKNIPRYMAVKINTFKSRQEAIDYMKNVEPTVPLVSLGGRSRVPPLGYDDFLKWKSDHGYKEYDYKSMYAPGGSNPREVVLRRR